MKLLDGELWLHWKELESYGFLKGALKNSTLRFRKGKTTSYENQPDPDNGKLNLIKYSTIPRREELLPTEDELIAKLRIDQFDSMAVEDPQALSYYIGKGIDSKRAQHYTEQAAWYMLCAPMNRKQARAMGYKSIDDFYSDVMTYTNKHDIIVIRNLASFKRSLKPFNQLAKAEPTLFIPDHKDYFLKRDGRSELYENALSTLISGKLGKKNAAKLTLRPAGTSLKGGDVTANLIRRERQTEEMQAEIIRLKKQTAPKLSDQQVYLFYLKTMAMKRNEYSATNGEMGWDEKSEITLQTCVNFIKASRQIWLADRSGKKAYENEFRPIIDRKRESRANAKWIIDGTPLHMYFMKDGKPYQRLNIFLVLDGHSYAILGYSLSFNENSAQVLAALRMACQNTGYLPDEIQSDNGKAINNWHVRHALETITPRWIPAEAGNARAKKIEAFFGHFNDRVLKFIPGYTGNPFAKLDTTRPNLDHINAMIKAGTIPSLEESWTLIENGLDQWNNQLFDNALPIQKYKKSLEATASVQRRFNDGMDVEAFWYMPGKMRQFDDLSASKRKKMSVFVPEEYEFGKRGILVQYKDLMGEEHKHLFDVPDPQFRFDNMGKTFRLKIEPTDFQKAYLYDGTKPVCDQDGKPMQVLPKRLFASAKVDQLPGENEEVYATLKQWDDQKEIRDKAKSRYAQVAEEAGLIEMAIESQNIYGGKDAINDGKEKLIQGLSRYQLGAQKTSNQ